MRYEKIEFRDFSEGEGQKFFLEDGYFDYSENLRNTEKTGITLSQKYEYVDIALTPGDTWFGQVTLDIYQYCAGYNAVSTRWEIWQRDDFGSFSMIRQLPATVTQIHALFKIKNRICLSHTDAGIEKNIYTDDDGANWTTATITNQVSWAYNYEQGETITGDNTTGEVFTTSDGINFTLLIDLSLLKLELYSAELYKNFTYLICTADDLSGTEEIVSYYVFRVEIDGLKQVALYDCAPWPDFFKFNDYLVFGYCKDKKAIIERFNGDTFEQVAVFDDKEYKYFFPLWPCQSKLYFTMVDTALAEQIGYLDESWSYFRQFALESGDESWLAEEKQNQITILTQTPAGEFRIYHTLTTYCAQGELHSSIINKGEIVPKQIILRHQPIEANTSIKVYTKENFASSWTLKLTSDTAGAVKKVYTYTPTAGSSIDFLQFKIELNTTSSTKTPKTPQITFLYLPKGLAQSK